MKRAFTLAETLITLGIIGVVASFLLPSVITNSIEKQRVAQLKKSYSELSQAFAFASNEYGTPDEWGFGSMYDENSHYILATNMKKYLKLSVDCVDMPLNQVQKVCAQSSSSVKKEYNNSLAGYAKGTGRLVILSNGTTVGFRVYDSRCNMHFGIIKNVCGSITVDINGSRLPNQNGEDQFLFYLTKNKLVPAGIPNASIAFERACNKSIEAPYPDYMGISTMYACTAWVLYNENQDYLHCNDLSWRGKKSCK